MSQRSKNSYVDETLFGGKKTGFATSTGIVSLEELRKIRTKTEKNQANDAVIISKTDLARIKQSTKIQTKDQQMQQKKLLEEQKEAAMAKAKQRKEKMQQMDATRAAKVKPTDFQVASKNKAETLLSKAQKKLDEEMDDVKHMN